MAETRLVVNAVGPMVSIQDAGRMGKMRFGVCASGPMDRFAHACANVAVGVDQDSTAIEISLGGLTVECVSGEVTVAVAGAESVVKHNEVQLAPWCVTTLHPGDQLSVRGGPHGSFAYLAFAGSLQCTPWLGSTATHTLSGFGGGVLSSGQELIIASSLNLPDREGGLEIPDIAQPLRQAHVVAGPQDACFLEASVSTFLSQTYRLSSAYDRMGVRLDGPHLTMKDALSIPSEPLVRGSVQVAGDGIPTVLLADHQTTGGYPKIATVISTDTDRLVQLRAGQPVEFVQITPAQAIALTRKIAAQRSACLEQISQPRGTLNYRLRQYNLIDGVVSGSE